MIIVSALELFEECMFLVLSSSSSFQIKCLRNVNKYLVLCFFLSDQVWRRSLILSHFK